MREISVNLKIYFLALNKTMKRLASIGQSLEDYHYENKDIMQIILDDLGDVKFDGVSVNLGIDFGNFPEF